MVLLAALMIGMRRELPSKPVPVADEWAIAVGEAMTVEDRNGADRICLLLAKNGFHGKAAPTLVPSYGGFPRWYVVQCTKTTAVRLRRLIYSDATQKGYEGAVLSSQLHGWSDIDEQTEDSVRKSMLSKETRF